MSRIRPQRYDQTTEIPENIINRISIRKIRSCQPRERKRKKAGKLPVSHRYNRLPLLRSHPGGVQEELIVGD